MLYDNLAINENGHLTFAGRDTVELADKYGTPLFVMDEERIRDKCRLYKNTLRENLGDAALPLFAGKALCFKGLYGIMNEEGMGIDVVSSGEIFTAFSAGFPMEKAFFHGNNKTDEDISFAMEKGVGYFICDGVEELDAIDCEAKRRGTKQKILLRVTPGIDAHTHAKITTGNEDSKFGTSVSSGQALRLAEAALKKENIILEGFHCHIGSQIFDAAPFVEAVKVMVGFMGNVKEALGFETIMLDLGGGIGVRYTENDPQIDTAAVLTLISNAIKEECKTNALTVPFVLVEPGRSIVADSGITLYKVGTRKEIPGVRNYVSIDGGMPDNPRYTLYGSAYTVLNAGRMTESADYICTVAGRCCESGDLIQENVAIAKPERNDVLAVLTTGAYNYSMASNYNAITKPPIVMISKEKEYVAVRRETFEDMICCQN